MATARFASTGWSGRRPFWAHPDVIAVRGRRRERDRQRSAYNLLCDIALRRSSSLIDYK